MSRNQQHEYALNLVAQGKYQEAIIALSQGSSTVRAYLDVDVEILFNKAADTAKQGRYKESAFLHCQLLAIRPSHAQGLRNFAIVLRLLGSPSLAEVYIKEFISQCPGSPEGYNTFGTILSDLGRNQEAVTAFKSALSLDLNHAEANSNLANEYHLAANLDLAFLYSTKAVFHKSFAPLILLDHLTQLRRVCDFNRISLVDWHCVASCAPADRISSSFLQLLVNSESHADQIRFRLLAEKWSFALARQGAKKSIQNRAKTKIANRQSTSPINIGLVSGDFRDHSVARFILPLFKYLDRTRFHLHCFSTYQIYDAWRDLFESSSESFSEISACSVSDAIAKIKDKEIDILIDLAGFTKGAKPLLFIEKAAPIQVGWLGFPGTSGSSAIDYLFLDRYLAPSRNSLITEKPLVTAGTTVCFDQMEEIHITDNIPEIVRGFITLGSLNNPYKFTPSAIARWSQVLKRIPHSKFLFARREFQSYFLRQNIINEFEKNGIDNSRIFFFNNRKAGRHYLDCYNEIDITLDTYPVTGGTTTVDSLWMGVPVVCIEGENIHQRVCSSILRHAGFPEWIAQNDDKYIEIAVQIAKNQPNRIRLRQAIREQLKKTSLCDGKKFAADFGKAMEEALMALENKKASSH